MRRTFIYFCKSAVKYFSRQFFKENFLEEFLAMAEDQIPIIRMEFAHSLVIIKPSLEDDINLNIRIMEIMNKLR